MLPGQSVLEALEAVGLHPPYSCRAGACAACMCKLEEGKVELLNNNVLEESELAEGWILSCQAVAQSPKVRVKYPS
jgi:3-ketosteroid 9alpha-monooxygenase subunit B